MVPVNIATIERAIEHVPGLAEVGRKVGQGIHQAVLSGEVRTRAVADVLHGTWLGHPLHPVLTDVPIGAWMLGGFYDLLAVVGKDPDLARTADKLTAVGVLAAIPTVLAGVADYSAIQEQSVPIATAHGLLNTAGLMLNLLSWRDRAAGNRGRGVALSTVALGFLTVSAWLGGELVYAQRVGVNHEPESAGPAEWTAALDARDLPERTPKRVEVEGAPILLFRDGTTIHAIGAVCSHAGGPLDEGTVERGCVQCPWHHSVFDLSDGRVIHGPATYPEPAFETREREGKIELRARPPETSM